MKRILLLVSFLIFILLITGCIKDDKKSSEQIKDKIVDDKGQEVIDEYIDDNSIKIALYKKENGVYKRQDTFLSPMESFNDIALFSIILDDKKEMSGSIKGLYQEYKNKYENFSNYKIGYQIEFKLKDGTHFKETILKPVEFSEFSFSNYLYVWLYDDINNSGWYSHLESDEVTSDTVMSSIKLMSTTGSKEIDGPIRLTVFTYDLDDFDELGYYRGVSQFTTSIERVE